MTQYNAVQHSILPFNAVQHNIIQHFKVQHNVIMLYTEASDMAGYNNTVHHKSHGMIISVSAAEHV